MRKRSRFICCAGCLILAVTGIPSVLAQNENGSDSITLINGVNVSGKVLGVSAVGMEVMVGKTRRTYPWYALSPGTRFKFDQTYRMNIDGYLAGSETSRLTNAPDPDYDPLKPGSGPSPAVVEPVSATTSLNYGLFGVPSAIIPVSLPALSIVPADGLSFYALQYGATSSEVVLFGFSTVSPGELIILDLKEGQVITEKSSTRKIADMEFKAYARKSLQSNFDSIAAEQNVQWLVDDRKGGGRFLHAEITLTRGAQKTSFILQGDPSGLKSGKEGVQPKPLLVEPTMSFTIQIENEKTYLAGRVRMGRLSLLPRSGMDLKVEVDIADASGRSILKRSLVFNADGLPDAYPLRMELDQLLAGQQYKLTATMSLGALLGKISHEMYFIMPDATKL